MWHTVHKSCRPLALQAHLAKVLRLLVLFLVMKVDCHKLNILQAKLPDIPASCRGSQQGDKPWVSTYSVCGNASGTGSCQQPSALMAD